MPKPRTDADDVFDEKAPPVVNKVAGEHSFVDYMGRTWVLRPTFEAALEIEDALGMSVDGLRNKFAMALDPRMAPTTREHGVIIAAGIRGTGETRVTAERAAKLAWQTGRRQLRPTLLNFLWALSDGGRGRAEDLGKEASSNGSLDADEEMTSELIQAIALPSADTSD